MSLCPPSLDCSEAHSANRIEAASETLGEAVVQRLLAFALFLMGARREDVARHLSMPTGTLFSLLTRVSRHGLPAFEDRRRSHSEFLPAAPREAPALEVTATESGMIVDFGAQGHVVSLPADNVLQTRTFLLTLMANGLLERSRVAELLGYSSTHTERLARQLTRGDVTALLDRREGRKEDYRVTAEVKPELVQQYVVNVITGGKTSGEAISTQLEERCGIHIPPRTVRHHLAKMGLPLLRRSLPELLEAVKKTSRESSGT
jgi:hypothetical protein